MRDIFRSYRFRVIFSVFDDLYTVSGYGSAWRRVPDGISSAVVRSRSPWGQGRSITAGIIMAIIWVDIEISIIKHDYSLTL